MKIAFPYPGGKARIRKTLFEYFPEEGRYYVEPFAGRGNVFFGFYNISNYNVYLLNDLNLGKFFTSLRDADLSLLPSKIEDYQFETWYNKWLRQEPLAYVVEPKITFRGKGYPSGWQKGRYSRIRYKAMCERAQRILKDPKVEICQRDYMHLDWSNFTEDDFVYLDPPYYETSGVGYGNINHEELLSLLQDAPFRWALSGYLSDLYIAHLGQPVLELTRNLEMTDDKGSTAVEALWSNM